MIKNYLELNEPEMDKFMLFINRNKLNKLWLQDVKRKFKSEEFDFGVGVIVNIDDVVTAAASVVLKECGKKGTAYVTNLDIDENARDKQAVLFKIIEESRKLATKYGARHMFLGTKDNAIIGMLNNSGMERQYSAVRMILEDRKVKYPVMNLIKLSEQNKEEYLTIYNDAFEKVPNGATLSAREAEVYIKKSDENNCCYIAEADNESIGFLQFHIEDGIGEFDLGLISTARGKGNGKLLLETAISFLNEKNVKEISLKVITKNIKAYDMYKKRGFVECELISQWFQINLA